MDDVLYIDQAAFHTSYEPDRGIGSGIGHRNGYGFGLGGENGPEVDEGG